MAKLCQPNHPSGMLEGMLSKVETQQGMLIYSYTYMELCADWGTESCQVMDKDAMLNKV